MSDPTTVKTYPRHQRRNPALFLLKTLPNSTDRHLIAAIFEAGGKPAGQINNQSKDIYYSSSF